MAIQNINISKDELFLKNSTSLHNNDLASSDNFDSHLTTDKINSRFCSESYKRYLDFEISKTFVINIPNTLFLLHMMEHYEELTRGFHYHNMKFSLTNLFLKSDRTIANLISFFKKKKKKEKNEIQK